MRPPTTTRTHWPSARVFGLLRTLSISVSTWLDEILILGIRLLTERNSTVPFFLSVTSSDPQYGRQFRLKMPTTLPVGLAPPPAVESAASEATSVPCPCSSPVVLTIDSSSIDGASRLLGCFHWLLGSTSTMTMSPSMLRFMWSTVGMKIGSPPRIDTWASDQ